MQATSVGRLLIACLMGIAAGAGAADDQPVRQASLSSANLPPAAVFNYQPPDRGAPGQRVGGGTRSISQLEVLAPEHTARTMQARPRLYWFISPGFRHKVRFRIGEAGVTPPLLEILLPPQPNGGVQNLDLAVHDVRLEPGKVYEWGVMLEPLPHQRMPPLVSLARMVFDGSAEPLQQAAPGERPYLAAQLGYWYDALDWISQLIESDQDSGELRLRRAGLLEQGGLDSTAAYEREMAR